MAGMNFVLLFGLLIGIGIPGLVLYFLRWGLIFGQPGHRRAQALWGLGLIHEIACVVLFSSSSMQAEIGTISNWLAKGYAIGAIISFSALLASSSIIASDDECINNINR